MRVVRPYWRSGQYNAICDVCGQRFKSGELKQRWDNLMVCSQDYEPRHPMDFFRPPEETARPFWTRSDLPSNIPSVAYEQDFSTSTDGWIGQNGTFIHSVDLGILTDGGSGNGLHIVRSFPGGFSGGDFTQVKIKFANIDVDSTEGNLIVYFTTDTHSYSNGFMNVRKVTFASNTEYTFDMKFLTAGSDNWINSVITGIRFTWEKDRSSGDEYEIVLIEISR